MNTARALEPNANAAPLSLATAQTEEHTGVFTLWLADLRPALALVSHATRSAFDPRTHIDFDWSPVTHPDDSPQWGVTATDGHRLARFTSRPRTWFAEPGRFIVALPGWILEWMKQAPDTTQVTFRVDAFGTEIVLQGYGSFRPNSAAFGGWRHLLADLRVRRERGEEPLSLDTTAVPALIKSLDTERHSHPGEPVFLRRREDEWSATFSKGTNVVACEPSYLIDALKALARTAKAERSPTVQARSAGRLDAIAFTAPNLLAVIMPRHK